LLFPLLVLMSHPRQAAACMERGLELGLGDEEIEQARRFLHGL